MNSAQNAFCQGACPYQELQALQSCADPATCPLKLPHIVPGDEGRLEFHLEGEVHYLFPHLVKQDLLESRYLVYLHQDGPEIHPPGALVPVRQELKTGTMYFDQSGDAIRIRLHEKSRRAWAVYPSPLYNLIEKKRLLVPVREVFEGVQG